MKLFYNIDIQMAGTYEPDAGIMELASHLLGFTKSDIEEEETHCVQVCFVSSVKPSDMEQKIRTLLLYCPRIHYVDTIYRWEYELTPDRVVIWGDGRRQTYTGKVIFTEDD